MGTAPALPVPPGLVTCRALRPYDDDVRRARLRSLLLGTGPRRSVLEVAEWFGAMQAQDLASGAWSFGVRIPGLTEADVQAAQENRDVLRTWPMRGTVHFVPARDAAWMVALMDKKPLAGGAARREFLGLTLAQVDRAVAALTEALTGGRVLTRDECVAVLRDAGLPTEGQRSYHWLCYACQVGALAQGPPRGASYTAGRSLLCRPPIGGGTCVPRMAGHCENRPELRLFEPYVQRMAPEIYTRPARQP